MDKVTYITSEGLEELKFELNYRAGDLRTEIADRLAKAIKMGDLKENADYQVAKEDQALNEGAIKELKNSIGSAKLIEAPTSTGFVSIGSTVTIIEDGEEDEEVYQIVGATEANPAKGKISNESPIGNALIGAKLNQTVTVKTPGGKIDFSIVNIS